MMGTDNTELIRRTGLVVRYIFSPPKNATSARIRLYGVAAWLAGFVSAIAGAAVLEFLGKLTVMPLPAMIVGILPLAGFGLMTIGGYRALSGKNEEVTSDLTEVSPLRVINGLFSLLASLVIAGIVVAALLYYLQKIGFDPRTFFGK